LQYASRPATGQGPSWCLGLLWGAPWSDAADVGGQLGFSRQIVMTWVLTFPACLVLGMLFALLFKAIL
jgi:phosphate/sulfate permease